jgi:hypothetical protein
MLMVFVKDKIKEVAGKDILDPLDGATACLEDSVAGVATTIVCQYYYTVCDGGTGYMLGTHFESKNNVDSKYDKDDVSTSDADTVFSMTICTNSVAVMKSTGEDRWTPITEAP